MVAHRLGYPNLRGLSDDSTKYVFSLFYRPILIPHFDPILRRVDAVHSPQPTGFAYVIVGCFTNTPHQQTDHNYVGLFCFWERIITIFLVHM